MTQPRKFPMTQPGAGAPHDFVMAVIDRHDDAIAAVQSLQRAGLHEDDMRLFDSEEVLAHVDRTETSKSLFERIMDMFQAVTSDENAHVLAYVEEARAGHNVINVHALEMVDAQQIAGILKQHNARNIKYFGDWSIHVLHH